MTNFSSKKRKSKYVFNFFIIYLLVRVCWEVAALLCHSSLSKLLLCYKFKAGGVSEAPFKSEQETCGI